MVEDLLAARGIIVSHQTVRLWAEKFGRTFANEIRRRSSGRLGDKWHLDEAVVSIRGKKHWLWRAVDHDGFVLDVLVQSRRNAKAAKRLIAQAPEGPGTAAPSDDHRQAAVLRRSKARDHARCRASLPQGVEYRAENSHQPVRRRERIMKRFNHGDIYNASSPSTIRSPTCFTSRATTSPPAIIANCARRR